MLSSRTLRMALAGVLVALLAAGSAMLVRSATESRRVYVVAYFPNSNGIFVGDEVRIMGVPVGKIDRIEPEPERVRISFWYGDRYTVPADAKAAILSPSLVTARAIQLTPPYTGGPVMHSGAVIPEERTAVPVEWDDLRVQLERLTDMLQPTQPGGTSALGALVTTTANNLRGQGGTIRDAVLKLSQAISALGDHSDDVFGTLRNLSTLVSALRDSADLLTQLNQNLASATGLLADEPNEIGDAVAALDTVVGDVQSFVAENRAALTTTTERLASTSTALTESLDDIKQTLHIVPTELQNLMNIYQPAQGALTGAQAYNNLANPISFLCGAIQAASRLGAEQSAKLCVQYLAPIVKNRQYNFPPLGENLIVGAMARPNEVTYSEDWMRPDYVPPPSTAVPNAPNEPENEAEADDTPATEPAPLLPAEVKPTDPAAGLRGMMVPDGVGP